MDGCKSGLAASCLDSWTWFALSDISSDGVVVTQHYLATEIGENILAQGGNAYDAAIAVGFALAVVLPRAGNIGGGGFMVIYDEDSNDTYAIDYREKAPAASFRDMYLDENGEFDILKSTFGYNAIGVPGTVHGFWSVHQRFGSLPWADLIHPAIILAERGFVMFLKLTFKISKKFILRNYAYFLILK